MREIKFRGWDKKSKKMYYNIEEMFNDDLAGVFGKIKQPRFCCFGAALNDKTIEIMQFTNLKDKKGKDIYEGDIVKFNYYQVSERIGLHELIEDKGIVTFIDFLGAWCILFGKDNYVQIKKGLVEFEIIGNKFDDQEHL